jgi:hypothetical protein
MDAVTMSREGHSTLYNYDSTDYQSPILYVAKWLQSDETKEGIVRSGI